MEKLTVCYMTNRRDCRIEWFLDSLREQCQREGIKPKVVVVDFYANEREVPAEISSQVDVWTAPKPTVWQGPHRLTTKDYFAPSNARNTGICFAEDGIVAFVDDLSVLMNGWLRTVMTASRGNVLLGRYAKVKELEVVSGIPVKYIEFDLGMDSRQARVPLDKRTEVDGGWMFGCSVAGHVEDFLLINGFDEDCDSMGGEDYVCGLMLAHHGCRLWYCPEMYTLESEELHFVEKPFARIIKHWEKGKSNFRERDASHAMLNMVRSGGRRISPNYCNLRELRYDCLRGMNFPISQIPQHDWRDSQPLSEM